MPIPTFLPGRIVASSRHTPAILCERLACQIYHAVLDKGNTRSCTSYWHTFVYFLCFGFVLSRFLTPLPRRQTPANPTYCSGTSIIFYGTQVSSEESMTTLGIEPRPSSPRYYPPCSLFPSFSPNDGPGHHPSSLPHLHCHPQPFLRLLEVPS